MQGKQICSNFIIQEGNEVGTKMGDHKYSDYQIMDQQGSLIEEEGRINSKEFENRAEMQVSIKLNKIQPDLAEMKALNQYAEQVQTDIGEKLSIRERHLFGSSIKNTMVDSSNKKDADILIVLDYEKHHELLSVKNGSKQTLIEVYDALKSNPKYKEADVTIDGSAVVIRRGEKIVDIVPAFRNPNGKGFLIPENRKGNKWIKSDPRTSKRILEIEDKIYHGQVRPMIQIAKDWNERNGRILKSYHMEAIVIQHFKNRNSDSSRSNQANVDDFFFRLPEYISSSVIRDQATEEKLGGYLSKEEKNKAINLAIKTRHNIERARAYKNEGDYERSLNYYGKVLYDEGDNK